MKKSARQFCHLSRFTTSPTSGQQILGEKGRGRKGKQREAHWSSPTLQPSRLVDDISSLTELQAMLGSRTVLTGQSQQLILLTWSPTWNIVIVCFDQVRIILPDNGGPPTSPRHPCSDSPISTQAWRPAKNTISDWSLVCSSGKSIQLCRSSTLGWLDLGSPWIQELYEHLDLGSLPWIQEPNPNIFPVSADACKSVNLELIWIWGLYLGLSGDISKHFHTRAPWTLALEGQWKIEASEHLAIGLEQLWRPWDFLLLKQTSLYQNKWNHKGF